MGTIERWMLVMLPLKFNVNHGLRVKEHFQESTEIVRVYTLQ